MAQIGNTNTKIDENDRWTEIRSQDYGTPTNGFATATWLAQTLISTHQLGRRHAVAYLELCTMYVYDIARFTGR
jgi:hypothetical protein